MGDFTEFEIGDTFDSTSAIYFDTSISDIDMWNILWMMFDDIPTPGDYPLVNDSINNEAIVYVGIPGQEPYLYASIGSNYNVIWAGDNSVTGVAGWQNVGTNGKVIFTRLEHLWKVPSQI